MIFISIIKKTDITLMITLAIIAVLGMVYLAGIRVGGGYAEILQHGEVVHTLDLSTDTVYTSTRDNFLNIIQISGGAASMLDANCPDSYCLHQAPIMYTGQTIVCLPNRLVVQIRAAEEGEHDIILR